MKPHEQRLTVLSQRGWKCQHPDKRHSPVSKRGIETAVYLTGVLWGKDREIYLAISDGLVMLIDDNRDVPFEEFLRWIDLACDPLDAKVSDRQRDLFGEDD